MTDATHGEKYRLACIEWARADGEARRLEEMKKVLFSELVNQSDSKSVAQAEHRARGNPIFKEHVETMVAARTKANILEAEVQGLKVKFEAWRTLESTKREEMRNLGR